jgi:hypothetical protein
MNQLPLFRQDRCEPERRAPDLDYIRKSLERTLRFLRDARYVPWSEGETASHEKQYPLLAALLPAEEAETYVSEFKREMARLRATG